MGGRGRAGGTGKNGGNAEGIILKTSPFARVSYKDYKNVLNGKGGDSGTYDAATKTIEANVGRGVHAVMDALPDNYVRESGTSRLKAAMDIYDNISAGVVTLAKNSPSWAIKVEKIVKSAQKLDDRYGINHSRDLNQYFALKRKGH